MLGWARRLYDPHPSHLVMCGKDAATSKSGVRESMTQGNSHGSDAAEQSSSMVGLRTMVMLAFLIAIPLMAVIGAGLPDSLRTAMQKGGGAILASPVERPSTPANMPATAAANPNTTSLVDATPPQVAQPIAAAPSEQPSPSQQPIAQPGPPRAAVVAVAPAPEAMASGPRARIAQVRVESDAPRAKITEVRTLPDSPEPVATAPLWAPAPRTASSPRGRQTTAHFESSQRRDRPRGVQSVSRKSAAEAPLQATAYSTASPGRGAEASSAAHETEIAAAGKADAASILARSESRLRELGAAHYRLEAWGDSGQLYRCTASVAMPGRRQASRHFEAVAAGPGEALDRLLEQIEHSRAARR